MNWCKNSTKWVLFEPIAFIIPIATCNNTHANIIYKITFDFSHQDLPVLDWFQNVQTVIGMLSDNIDDEILHWNSKLIGAHLSWPIFIEITTDQQQHLKLQLR